jgi:hypothetical protein
MTVKDAKSMRQRQSHGSHATAGIPVGRRNDMMSYSQSDLKDLVEFYKDQGVTAESITPEDIAGYLGISKNSSVRLLPKVQQLFEKSHGPVSSRSLTSSRKAAADLRDDVAKAAKKYLDEAKAQGGGDDESSILQRLKESWPYLVVSYLAKILKDVMTGKILDENRGTEFAASRNRMAQAGPTAPEQRNSKWASSEVIDRVATQLENLGKAIPREASNLRGMALRLDRVANTLEAEQEATERVSKIENELDDLGVDFTVAPNSSGKQASYIHVYKGQLGSRDEASVLGRIAKKHGSTLENGNRAYKITVPHHVGV